MTISRVKFPWPPFFRIFIFFDEIFISVCGTTYLMRDDGATVVNVRSSRVIWSSRNPTDVLAQPRRRRRGTRWRAEVREVIEEMDGRGPGVEIVDQDAESQIKTRKRRLTGGRGRGQTGGRGAAEMEVRRKRWRSERGARGQTGDRERRK